MEFLIPAFIAGFLTVLAPCVLTLLPIILGGTLGEKNPYRPLIITLSLGLSVFVFTLLLKATTWLIGVPPDFWRYFSGTLILLFGLSLLFPSLWTKITIKFKLDRSDQWLHTGQAKGGLFGAVWLGVALGPVFSTCSPTYALILAIVLPQNLTIGILNLLVYVVGLMIPLLLIGYGGQSLSRRFNWLSNPRGWFKRALGAVLIITGLMIFTGLDKRLESWILDSGYLGPIEIEQQLIRDARDQATGDQEAR